MQATYGVNGSYLLDALLEAIMCAAFISVHKSHVLAQLVSVSIPAGSQGSLGTTQTCMRVIDCIG